MLELPAGARKRRKATVKIQRNPLLRFLPLIQKILKYTCLYLFRQALTGDRQTNKDNCDVAAIVELT